MILAHEDRRLDWQSELKASYRTAEELLIAGLITPLEAASLEPVLAKYQFLLPRYYAGLIDATDPLCPIRLQAIPQTSEVVANDAGYLSDPLADLSHRPAPRITHRYRGRVLLHLTSNCSMYCRYCFRKTLLNELKGELFEGSLQEALEYLKVETSIKEVILSGGDPFLLSDRSLEEAIRSLARIPHLRRLRIHTRVPVTFPQRITASLCLVLKATPLPLVIVTHFNHPREITPESKAAVSSLHETGAVLLNQSVLLKGVNDDVTELGELSERLFDNGVLPYYLHHPDRAEGTQAFSVSRDKGLAIHEMLKRELPGYLVPRYVVDIVGEPYKSDVISHCPPS